jgi:hypothetical protein
MTTPKGRKKRTKILSSGKSVASMSKQPQDRFAFKNAGHTVSHKGMKLAGKTFKAPTSLGGSFCANRPKGTVRV